MYKSSPRSGRRDLSASATGTGMLHVGQNQSPSPSKAGHSHSHSQTHGTSNVSGVRQGAGTSSSSLGRRSRSRKGVTQRGRSSSPLSLQMESMQSVNTAYNMSQTYLGEGMGSPVPSPSSRSPYQSPVHSRSSSMSSMSLRDRSTERGGDYHLSHYDHQRGAGGSMVRDRSLDRQLDRRHREYSDHYHTYSHRDRSLDRDYPYMGAQSLGRDHHSHRNSNLVRSQSIDHEYMTSQAAFLPVHDFKRSRGDSLILDLQSQIAQLNKEGVRYFTKIWTAQRTSSVQA